TLGGRGGESFWEGGDDFGVEKKRDLREMKMVVDKYGKVKDCKKTVKIKQARTRESEEYKAEAKAQVL
ncbi:hypothetical protein Tco_1156730, partial [Tanacetum coccineum]